MTQLNNYGGEGGKEKVNQAASSKLELGSDNFTSEFYKMPRNKNL